MRRGCQGVENGSDTERRMAEVPACNRCGARVVKARTSMCRQPAMPQFPAVGNDTVRERQHGAKQWPDDVILLAFVSTVRVPRVRLRPMFVGRHPAAADVEWLSGCRTGFAVAVTSTAGSLSGASPASGGTANERTSSAISSASSVSASEPESIAALSAGVFGAVATAAENGRGRAKATTNAGSSAPKASEDNIAAQSG